MMKWVLIAICTMYFPFLVAEEVKVSFTPPSGWQISDSKSLPRSVRIMVVGKGEKNFPPSINLAVENFAGTTREYLKIIHAINSSHGNTFKDLGTIQTGAGIASLSQSIQKTEWGDVKMMHALLVDRGNAYILTASSLKEEFSSHYQEFFDSLRSLNFSS